MDRALKHSPKRRAVNALLGTPQDKKPTFSIGEARALGLCYTVWNDFLAEAVGFQHRPETRMDTHSRLLHLLKYPQNYPQKNLLSLASSLPPNGYANNPAQGTRRPRPQANRVTDLPSRAGARGREQIRKCRQAEVAPGEDQPARPKPYYKGRADYIRRRYNITRRCAVAAVSIFEVKSDSDIP